MKVANVTGPLAAISRRSRSAGPIGEAYGERPCDNRRMEPRAAATVILVRGSDAGPEVLVLRRGAAQRFLPGYVAFPGGAVDPGDADLAERWFGTPNEAARACAVRELAEEVGIAIRLRRIRRRDCLVLGCCDHRHSAASAGAPSAGASPP